MASENSDQMDGVSRRNAPARPTPIPRPNVRRAITGTVKMNQPQGSGGHFQGAPSMPVRQYPVPRPVQRGHMFNQFMRQGMKQPAQRQPVGGRPPFHMAPPPPPPPFRRPGGGGFPRPFPRPPSDRGPGGGPVLGNHPQGGGAQSIISAIMGDLAGGLREGQVGHMLAGNVPGAEHGDFARLLAMIAGRPPTPRPEDLIGEGGGRAMDPMQQIAALLNPQGQMGDNGSAMQALLSHILGVRAPGPHAPGGQLGGNPVVAPMPGPPGLWQGSPAPMPGPPGLWQQPPGMKTVNPMTAGFVPRPMY